MKPTQIIGRNIQKYRKYQDYTQEDLASYLGITREMISYYETGEREIPVTTLNKLSDLFGIDLEELLEENEAIKAANLAFAFRSDDNSNDFTSIASFKKIVLNYLKMESIRNDS